MSKSTPFKNDVIKLIFHGTTIAGLADNAATGPLTNLYLALHVGDPGLGGDQTTNEVSYTGYARVPIARTSGGWTITGNSVSPAANIEFGEMTAGTGGTVTHASVGTDASGVGKVIYKGALTPTIAVAVGVIPRIKTTSTITED